MNHSLSANRVHPGSWWLLGLCGALAANLAANIYFSANLIAAAVGLIFLCRDESVRGRSIRFYLTISAFAVLIRIGLHLIFQAEPITQLGVWVAAGQALKLAAIIMSIAVANTLASPRELLRSTPKALHELAAAIAIAINLAPQLVQSLQRVRRAAALRGRSKGMRSLNGILIPTLEDALQRSLDLAASMNARGFGKRAAQPAALRRWATVSAFGSLSLLGWATYSLMMNSESTPGLVLGGSAILLMALFVRLQGREVKRSRFRVRKLVWQDLLVTGIAIAVLVVGWWLSIPIAGD